MTIAFHCEHCGKKIEAPDSASGKLGKCPRCHNKVHVPRLDTNDELTLAPIDENDEAKQKQLMAETYKLAQDILLEREAPNGKAKADTTSASGISDKELTKNIIAYLRQMAISEMPEPELADVPPQVLSGLIRDLRAKIS